jgi:hypothetical protein
VSVFSDPEVILLLRNRFVPVAVDNHHIEKQRDAEGDFYRKVASHQGEYICTAEGKLLGSVNTHSAAHLRGLMLKALENFRPGDAPPAAEGAPDPRFHRASPEGGLIVGVTTKVLGGYERSENRNVQIFQQSLGRDHLWIEKEDVQALAAGKFADRLRKRIACYHLVDNTRGEPPWWRGDEIRKLELAFGEGGQLKGSVDLESAAGDRGYTAELLGVAGVKEGKLVRLDLVAKGQAWGAGRYNGGQPPGRYPLAVAFTLIDPTREADFVLPQGACRGNLNGYFKP